MVRKILEQRLAALEALKQVGDGPGSTREILRRLSDNELAALEDLAEQLERAIAGGEDVQTARARFEKAAGKLVPDGVMQRPVARA